MSCINKYLTPLAAMTISSLIGYVCISFPSGFGEFLTFFLADSLKFGQVEWEASVNSNPQIFPQILNGIQVWALAGPLKEFHVLVLKPFQCCFGCMLGGHCPVGMQIFTAVQGLLHSEAGSPQRFACIWLHSLFPRSSQVSQFLPLKNIPKT